MNDVKGTDGKICISSEVPKNHPRFKQFMLTQDEINKIKSTVKVGDVAKGIFIDMEIESLKGLEFGDQELYYLGFMNKKEINRNLCVYQISEATHNINGLDYTFYHIIKSNRNMGIRMCKTIVVYGEINMFDTIGYTVVENICDKCFTPPTAMNRKMRRAKGNVINVSNKGNTMGKSSGNFYGGMK